MNELINAKKGSDMGILCGVVVKITTPYGTKQPFTFPCGSPSSPPDTHRQQPGHGGVVDGGGGPLEPSNFV